MKTKVMAILLAVVFCAAVAAAQSSQSQNTDQQSQKHEQQEQNQAATTNMTGDNMQNQHHMTGKVMDGGKRFLSDNTSYLIGNPKTLKKYDNQTVSIEFRFQTSTNQLHVTKVTPSTPASQ